MYNFWITTHTLVCLSPDGAALSFWLRSALVSRSSSSGLWAPSAACCSKPSAPTRHLRSQTQTSGLGTGKTVFSTRRVQTHRADSCPVGVFGPKLAQHSYSLVSLFKFFKKKKGIEQSFSKTLRLVLIANPLVDFLLVSTHYGQHAMDFHYNWFPCKVSKKKYV